MKRNELTEALCEASMVSGYAFHTGPAHRINGEVRVYPAAWLEPPVLSSSEGRTEGDITYRTTLHLMALPATVEERESLWTALEADAIAVSRRLMADSRVCEVSKISCIPAAQSLTAHGEVSVTLACDVKMWYYF